MVTAKKVRTELEQTYNICLKDHKKSLESLVMECFYELQDQQSSVSMHESSDGRDSNVILTTSVSSPETTTISDDGKSMLMGMQLPDYNPFQQHIGSYSLDDFSMSTSQYITYSQASNLHNHMMNVQNNGIDFMPEIRSRNQKIQPLQSFQSHSPDSFNNVMSQDPMGNFASHVSSNYLPYYTFSSSVQPAIGIKAPETQQYHISPTTYGQFHQAYDAQYKVQQMKQHEMGGPILGASNSQLQNNSIQQQPYAGGCLGNGQSWPLTIAKLQQMNMKSNVKKSVGKAKRKRRTAAIVDNPNAPPKPKRNTGLNKPLILSPILAAFTGVSEVSYGGYICYRTTVNLLTFVDVAFKTRSCKEALEIHQRKGSAGSNRQKIHSLRRRTEESIHSRSCK
jgi:hypothetical protein